MRVSVCWADPDDGELVDTRGRGGYAGSVEVGHRGSRSTRIVNRLVLAEADVLGKKFVFATEGREDPESLRERALVWEMDDFEVEDFASFCSFYVGEKASALDFGKIHRFAIAAST